MASRDLGVAMAPQFRNKGSLNPFHGSRLSFARDRYSKSSVSVIVMNVFRQNGGSMAPALGIVLLLSIEVSAINRVLLKILH